jgi:hypothetical protein
MVDALGTEPTTAHATATKAGVIGVQITGPKGANLHAPKPRKDDLFEESVVFAKC